jgi:ubiquinone/menaquinone biosynthesis C-methylase UbiE
MSGWHKVRAKTVADRYDRLARRYETRWRHYVRASVRETVARLSLRPGIRVLDLGCGTGLLLREIETTVRSAFAAGLDVSREMLTVARGVSPSNVAFVRGDVHHLPWSSESFDLVVSSSSFHYWATPLTALGEIARVLAPDGRLVITDWCDDFLACRICDRILRLLSGSHARIYDVVECSKLLREAGYRVVGVDRYKIDLLWGLMTATAELPAA